MASRAQDPLEPRAHDPRAHRAVTVFIALSVASSFCSTLGFASIALYRFRVAGLTDVQLVLVGTAMEAAVLVAEIPTGVVADLVSRRLSIVIGTIGMGIGLVIEAAWPSVAGVLTGTVVWGIAYTFTSGATVAWLAGEMGEPDAHTLGDVMLRASRWRSSATVVAAPVAFGVAAWSLRAPVLMAGAAMVLVGLWLALRMPEHGFEPAEDRSTWRGAVRTARSGAVVIRSSRALVWTAVAIFVAGGSSEAYDRYGQKHLVSVVGVPGDQSGVVIRIGVIAVVSAVVGVGVSTIVRRHNPGRSPHRVRRWLGALVVGQAVALVVLATTGSLLVAAAAIVVVDRTRSVRSTLMGSWVVPLTPRRERATVLSTLEQADAVSQVTVGPMMGVIGGAFGTGAAIAVSALALLPALPALRIALRSDTAA